MCNSVFLGIWLGELWQRATKAAALFLYLALPPRPKAFGLSCLGGGQGVGLFLGEGLSGDS